MYKWPVVSEFLEKTQISENAHWNVRFHLKDAVLDSCQSESGKLFHVAGVVYENTRTEIKTRKIHVGAKCWHMK